MVGLGWRLFDDDVGIVSEILGDVVLDCGQEEPTLDELNSLIFGDVTIDGIESIGNVHDTLGPFRGVLRRESKGSDGFGLYAFVLGSTRLYGIAVITEWVGWFVFIHVGLVGWRLLSVLKEVIPVQHVLAEAWVAVRMTHVLSRFETFDDWERHKSFGLLADGTGLLVRDTLTWIQ
jgi:hypothetical protein